MRAHKTFAATLLIAGAFLIPLLGCSSSAPGTPPPSSYTENGGGSYIEPLPDVSTSAQGGSIEQMRSATLQYPSSNSEWEYNVYDCYIELTKYLGPETTTLTIPAEIDGLPVWSLNTGGDANNGSKFPGDAIQTVRLPDCLVEVGDFTFYHCDLTSISLPSGLQKIGAWAFCGDYDEITIPASVREVGEGAFVSRHSYTATVLSPDVVLGFRSLYDADIVVGYPGSTAAQYCVDHADSVYKCTFQAMK